MTFEPYILMRLYSFNGTIKFSDEICIRKDESDVRPSFTKDDRKSGIGRTTGGRKRGSCIDKTKVKQNKKHIDRSRCYSR